jgi:hypothetical protein
VSEDDTTYGPSHKANRKRQVSHQRTRDRIQVGKEQLVEDQTRCRAEDEEVIPFDGGPYGASKGYFLRRDLFAHPFPAKPLHAIHKPPLSLTFVCDALFASKDLNFLFLVNYPNDIACPHHLRQHLRLRPGEASRLSRTIQ